MHKYLLLFFISLLFNGVFAQADFTIQGNLCQGNTLSFTDASVVAESWTWDFGDTAGSTDQNPSHSYADSGTYTVTLSIVSGANTYSKSRTYQISKNPSADFLIDTTRYSSYSRIFTDSSTLYNSFAKCIWNFGDNSATIESQNRNYLYKYPAAGNYTVKMRIIDSKGCTDSISKNLEIYDRFKVPNVFTPNEDKVNDEFIVYSNGVSRFSIEIYSRWGNLLFKRTGQEQIVWDGRLPDGTIVKPGTYYYVITPQDGTDSYESEQGFITVFY
ncbi:MAG: PKD domain-containing protein [Salinivirgaceae bacterium]